MKRMVALFLSLLLLCAPLWVSAAEKNDPVTKGYLGDVNLDGAVNAIDALCILRYAVEKESLSLGALHAAQTNDDDVVNAVDALNILKYAVGKESPLYQGAVQTTFASNSAFAYWKVVEDDICTTEQAWHFETYEEYQNFLDLGYINKEEAESTFNAAFFETYSLVLWYRMSGMTTGSLHYKGAFVKGDCVYLDIVPYGTCVIDFEHAIDKVYGFHYKKGDNAVTTVVMRKCTVGDMYRKYSLSQFDFPQS